MALHKLDSLKDYAAYLRGHPAEASELYSDILIHVTGFFRDAAVFQVLKRKVFPRIVRQKRAGEPLRVWVPGCSTGEEVYSLAIVLTEFLAERKLNHPVQIFGTDINDTALEKARVGIYPESIPGDMSAERLRRFFVKMEQRLPDQQERARDVHLRPAQPGGGPALLEAGPDQLPQRADLPGASRCSARCCRSSITRCGPMLSCCWGPRKRWAASATCSRWWTRRPGSMPGNPPAPGPR